MLLEAVGMLRFAEPVEEGDVPVRDVGTDRDFVPGKVVVDEEVEPRGDYPRASTVTEHMPFEPIRGTINPLSPGGQHAAVRW